MPQVSEHARSRSYFIGHGTADPVIPAAMAAATIALLKDKGLPLLAFNSMPKLPVPHSVLIMLQSSLHLHHAGCSKVTQKMYQGIGHSTSRQELDDVKDFLLTVIPEEALPPVTRYKSFFKLAHGYLLLLLLCPSEIILGGNLTVRDVVQRADRRDEHPGVEGISW